MASSSYFPIRMLLMLQLAARQLHCVHTRCVQVLGVAKGGMQRRHRVRPIAVQQVGGWLLSEHLHTNAKLWIVGWHFF